MQGVNAEVASRPLLS